MGWGVGGREGIACEEWGGGGGLFVVNRVGQSVAIGACNNEFGGGREGFVRNEMGWFLRKGRREGMVSEEWNGVVLGEGSREGCYRNQLLQ